jgi:hypothetical protein
MSTGIKEQTSSDRIVALELEVQKHIKYAQVQIGLRTLAQAKLSIAVKALEENATGEYRGNRSCAAERAFKTLEEIKKMGE